MLLAVACGSPPPERVRTVGRPPDVVAVEAGDGAAYARVLRFASAVSYRRTLDFAAAVWYRRAIEVATLVERAKIRETSPPKADTTRSRPKSHYAPPSDGSVWDRLAACESGGDWSINTGNGFYGGLQFTISSWRAVGGSGLPSDASREEQIRRGQALQRLQGWGAWPACARRLGLL